MNINKLKEVYMICGFVSLIIFGAEFPTVKLEKCQHSKVDCQAYVSKWLSKIPPTHHVYDQENDRYYEVELFGVRDTDCHLLPKPRPRGL